MLKPLIAGITAFSLTLATAMPAQAEGLDRDDIGKLLIGLAAIAALNAALENNNRRDDRDSATRRTANNWADLNRPHPRHEPHRHHPRSRDLPRDCLRNVETRLGTQRMFVTRCLERNSVRVNRLPGRCAVRVFTDNGPRSGFDPRCLRDAGYRSTRGH